MSAPREPDATGGPSRTQLPAPPPTGQARLGRLLVLLAAVALFSVAGISAEIFMQTQALRRNVAATSTIADANVRTLGQTQREVLRLALSLEQRRGAPLDDADRAALLLGVELTEQRTQESSLPYHARALGAPRLFEKAVDARVRWTDAVRPRIEAYLASGSPADLVAAEDGLRDLELRYNDIAAVAANNRRAVSGEANANARALLQHSRRLIIVIGLGTVLGTAALVGLLVTSRRLAVARRRHHRDLVALTTELTGLAEVVRTTGALVARTDTDGRLTWINDAAARHFAVSTPALVDRSVDDLAEALTAPSALTLIDTEGERPEPVPLEEVLRRGTPFVGELVVRLPRDVVPAPQTGEAGGTTIEHHLTIAATPVLDAGGHHVGWSVVGNDITDQVTARDLLERARAEAERVADEKSRFLATMSHEIRTPLHAVLGLQEVLAHSDLDDEQTQHLQQARVSAQHLLDLVNDVLDFSALDAGRIENLLERLDVRACASDLLGLFGHEAAARDLSLTLEVDEGVPTVLLLDGSHLRRVLVNLLGNALKYTDVGGVHLTVGWTPGDPAAPGGPGMLRLRVRDTGVGVDPAEVDALFEPFARARSTRDRSSGTGLGLWICRRVVDLLGGRITLEPAVPGPGTVAVVDLPAEPATDEQTAGVRDTTRQTEDLGGLRVLIADDDDVNRFVLRALLRRLGIEPVVADGGEHAVALLVDASPTSRIDVALLDQRMPDLDGTDVAAAVRALRGEDRPRLVVVTADALPGDRERLLAAGMDDYLAKPVTLEALRVALERVPTAVRI